MLPTDHLCSLFSPIDRYGGSSGLQPTEGACLDMSGLSPGGSFPVHCSLFPDSLSWSAPLSDRLDECIGQLSPIAGSYL
jgi:hypothetical protein